MELEQYIKEKYPEVVREHYRSTTPFYYESGAIYHPLRSGFGCSGPNNKRLRLVNGTYTRSGNVYMHLESLDEENTSYGVSLHEAVTSIARVNESEIPSGNHIVNDRSNIFMSIDGINYDIHQGYWRTYDTKRLGGRVWVHSTSFGTSGQGKAHYYELYNHLGKGVFSMKHVYHYDSVGREDYKFTPAITVREFKQRVFGNPNIKFKCQLFADKY